MAAPEAAGLTRPVFIAPNLASAGALWYSSVVNRLKGDTFVENKNGSSSALPLGMCLGLAVGSAIGAATHQIGLWMPLGLAFGVLFGAVTGHSGGGKDGDGGDAKP